MNGTGQGCSGCLMKVECIAVRKVASVAAWCPTMHHDGGQATYSTAPPNPHKMTNVQIKYIAAKNLQAIVCRYKGAYSLRSRPDQYWLASPIFG